MRRKEERSKQGQTNNKANQHKAHVHVEATELYECDKQVGYMMQLCNYYMYMYVHM